jgi:hypothetical protein
MKKHIFILLTIFFTVSLWAQPPGTEWREDFRQREPVSVSGTLVLADGFIALKSADALYYTNGLERLVGFIDGLKENAQVRLEGYDLNRVRASRTPDTSQTETTHFLWVTKLEIDGRSYELSRIAGGGFPERGSRTFREERGFWSMHGCGPAFGRQGSGRSGRGFDGPPGPGSGRHGRGRSGR